MKKVLLILLCLVLQACTLPRSLPETTEVRGDKSEVVVIGKVELVPPLDPKVEQKTYWNVIGDKRMLSRVWISTGGEYKPVKTSQLDGSDFQRSLEVEWGKPFMVKAPRRRTFINGGVAYLDVREQEKLWFPGGYYFDVPKGVSALYIGTLRYYRNDFNVINRVEIVNEREDVASVLKSGASEEDIRTSLLKRVR